MLVVSRYSIISMLSTLILIWRSAEWRTGKYWRVGANIAVARLWLRRRILTVDGGHRAIDEPVSSGWFAWMGQQAGQRGNRSQLHIGWFNEIICRVIIVLRGILHHIMPDGAGSCNTDHVLHLAIIAIAGPDSHRQKWRIAHRPVIAKTVGRA